MQFRLFQCPQNVCDLKSAVSRLVLLRGYAYAPFRHTFYLRSVFLVAHFNSHFQNNCFVEKIFFDYPVFSGNALSITPKPDNRL